MKPTALALRAAGYLRPYRRVGAVAVVCTVAQAALALVPALALRGVVDDLARSHPVLGHVVLLSTLALVALAVAAVLGVLQTYVVQKVGEGLVFQLREQLFDRLLGQSVAYHARHRAGDALSSLLNDVSAVENVLANALVNFLSNGLGALTVLGLMLYLDWRLTIVTLLLIPLMLLPVRRVGRAAYRTRDHLQRRLALLTGHAQEVLDTSAVMLVKALGTESTERERFRRLNDDVRQGAIDATMATQWYAAGLQVLRALGPVVLVIVGADLIVHHSASLGTLLAFATVLLTRLGQSLQNLISTVLTVAGSLAPWRRIFDVLDDEPEVREAPGAVPLHATAGVVRMDEVAFSYPGRTRPALADVSFQAEPGQVVAVVGPSGAGKSTLFSLLLRFQDPQRGSVSVDGQDLRDVTFASLSDAVGVVFQDTFLFHATIAENLRYARPDASEAEVAAALRDAHLDEVVAALPDGSATVVGERGHRLSGGEKQRLAIARLMLKDPQVLLLDEATAHMDSTSERVIQEALTKLFCDRTALVIAHRLSTVLAADLILVLEKGRIVERGRHAELLAADGLYARLYRDQFVPAAPEPDGLPALVV